jgi:hypothetical protein
MKTTGEDLSNACKDGKRAVVEAPNWGGANACDTRQPPIMKGEDTKESWCRWSCQAERRRSSKHRNQGGGLRGVYRNFLFLCNQWQWSPIVHMVVENFGATLKHLNWRRLWPPMKSEDILDGRCVRVVIGAPVQTAHDNGRRHLREGVRAIRGAPFQTAAWRRAETPQEKVCGSWYEPSSERPKANVMARYEWTGV